MARTSTPPTGCSSTFPTGASPTAPGPPAAWRTARCASRSGPTSRPGAPSSTPACACPRSRPGTGRVQWEAPAASTVSAAASSCARRSSPAGSSWGRVWMIGFDDEPHRSGEITLMEVFGTAAGEGATVVGCGIKAARNPTLRDEFHEPRLPMRVRPPEVARPLRAPQRRGTGGPFCGTENCRASNPPRPGTSSGNAAKGSVSTRRRAARRTIRDPLGGRSGGRPHDRPHPRFEVVPVAPSSG